MCGISGIISLNGREISHSDIYNLNKQIIHRGPDSEGFFIDDNIALAHRRLSIIDLEANSNQPFFYEDKFVLIFNGEIFNYIELRDELRKLGHFFKTNSDTEVLIKAYSEWGESCLDKFNGMWAFAIWDRVKKSLFCSRDRYGIKPFYWVNFENKFYFASEIKQLRKLKLGNKCNYEELSIFMYSGCANSSSQTFFKDINNLLPGHSLNIHNNGEIKIKSWYQIRNKIQLADAKFDTYEFKYHLKNAVNLRMRSDVKIGASLSGGLDSSSVISLISEILEETNNNEIFSAIHAKSSDFLFDESRYAELACESLNFKLSKIEPSYQDFFNSLSNLIHFQDEPFASSNIFMQFSVMQKAKNLGIKVMIGGQGSDEVLLGYERFFLVNLLAHYYKKGFKGLFDYFYFSLKNNKQFNIFSILKYIFGNYSGSLRAEFLRNRMHFLNLDIDPTQYLYKEVSKAKFNPLEAQFIELEKTSLPQILRVEDRNSMAHSIESRLPFLDFNFVEYCLSLLVTEKVQNGWSKYPLRNSNILKKEIAWRKSKFGFDGFENEWDRKYSHNMLKKVKLSPLIKNISNINKLSKDWFKLSPKERWRIFNVCIWQEINNVDF